MVIMGFKSPTQTQWLCEDDKHWFIGSNDRSKAAQLISREEAEALAYRDDGLGLADCLMAPDEILIIEEV